ncbi:MAG TPA: Crp/Fnr family transcriptional regulator [Vicinamibacterales bacterium]|nr:Crp/Fnr family transcriptional regulator [Vicinamibacterales bacterium]
MGPDHTLLAGLPRVVWERLETGLERVPLLQGQALQGAGEPARHTYFVTAGLVSLFALTVDGATLELATIASNGVIGLPMILQRSATPCQAVVQIAGDAFRIPVDVLGHTLRDSPALSDACLRYADSLLNDFARSTVCHHFHPLSERLCRWLLNASDQVQSAILPLTHDTLAQVLGAQRSAVSAAAADLQRAEAIRSHWGSITLLNRRRLEVSACSCYAASRETFALTPPSAPPSAASTRTRRR